jgi:hypothetical protein
LWSLTRIAGAERREAVDTASGDVDVHTFAVLRLSPWAEGHPRHLDPDGSRSRELRSRLLTISTRDLTIPPMVVIRCAAHTKQQKGISIFASCLIKLALRQNASCGEQPEE